MDDRAATPRRVRHSEKLDRLNRLRREYVCRPFAFDKKYWVDRRISSASPAPGKGTQEQEHKRMIKEVEKGVKGLEFPAEEMAKIIRTWIASDEK